MLSTPQIDEIKRLRAEGNSYQKIADELGICRITVIKYARDIELTKEQIDNNERLRKSFVTRHFVFKRKAEREQ